MTGNRCQRCKGTGIVQARDMRDSFGGPEEYEPAKPIVWRDTKCFPCRGTGMVLTEKGKYEHDKTVYPEEYLKHMYPDGEPE